MSQLALSGEVDLTSPRIRELEQEVERLKFERDQAIAQAKFAERQAGNSVAALRKVLSPLFQALRGIYGEMDAIAPDQLSAAQNGDPRWDSWKERLPGRPAEFIDLLLVHGSMSVKQFMAAAHCRKDAVYSTVSKLGQAGVVINNGGRYSLRP